jgi:hypothetical protein
VGAFDKSGLSRFDISIPPFYRPSMTDEAPDVVLDHLCHIRGAVDGLREDAREIRGRLTAVELGLAAVRREIAVLAEADAHLSAQLDRFSDRLDRIERRLDLAPAP